MSSSTQHLEMSTASLESGRAERSKNKLRRILYIVVVLLVIFLTATIVLAVLYVKKDSDAKSASQPERNAATTVTPTATNKPNCSAPTGSPPKLAKENNGGPYAKASVAADDVRCSNVGAKILRRNGSAVDAAIATLFCIGVINLHSAGIGGGSVMVVYSRKNGMAEYFNFREIAPGNASRDMFVNKTDASKLGALAIAVPGQVKGMYEAHKRYGKLKWKDLVSPAIKYARDGFIIHDSLDRAIELYDYIILEYEGMRDLFVKEDGCLKRKGDLLVNRQLAITLERISNDPDSFYTGNMADDIVKDISSQQGIITKKDLRSYSVEVKKAINASIGDHKLFTSGLPSSGILLTFILNVLKGYNFTSDNIANDIEKGKTYHKIIETFKYAYARRALLGDSNYANISKIYSELLSSEYAENIRMNISANRTYHNASHYGGFYSNNDAPGTSHVSVLAQNGDAVSLTSTINTYFGSKIRSTVTGIIYNNEMDDFSTPGLVNVFGVEPSPSNFIEPGKRPMSSMTPVIFTDPTSGDVVFIVGASGGTRITTSTSLVSMNKLWFGLTTREAVEAPRFHHQLLPDFTWIERGNYTLSSKIVEQLRRFGHNFKKRNYLSVIEAISGERNGSIYAKSDSRKGGYPAGF